MKKKIILLIISLGIGLLLFGKGLLVQTVFIDVLDKDEKSFSRKELNKEDSETISKIISPKVAIPDRGFVFAEGNYRIVFETFGLELHMYPYCGYPETIRVGDKGSWFFELDMMREQEAETIKKIADRYTGSGDGIGDWSNVK